MPAMPQQPLISGLPTAPQSNQSLLGDLVGPPLTQQPPLIPPLNPPKPNVPDLISGQPLSQPLISQPLVNTQPLINPPLTQPVLPPQPINPPLAQPIIPPLTQPMIPPQPIVPTNNLIGQNPPLIPNLPMESSFSNLNQPLIQPIAPQNKAFSPTDVPATGQSPLMSNVTTVSTVGSLVTSPPSGVNSLAGVIQPVTSTPLAAMKSDSMSKPGSLVTSPTEMPMGVMSPPAAVEWGIPQPQKLKYTQLFNATDRAKTGSVSGAQARSIMLQSRLAQQALAQIWALADLDSDGKLGCEEFVLAMYLCEKATQGEPVPAKLPPELIPPTFRRDSVSSNTSAKSYEERRRENMARGQAELERRRSQLADAAMKEKAERERKEREEAEKREKLRLEAQKREQEEKNARQPARKWSDNANSNGRRNAELNSVVLRASNLAKDIRETRTSVAAAKCTIDGMRSDRDSSMAEMQQLKARVKELNAKQIALNKEKAELDAKVEAAKALVESKKQDLETNKAQLSELSNTVTELGEKCARVWKLYEEKREEYLSRSSAPAESAWNSEADWGSTANDAWGEEPAADNAWGDAPPTTATEAVPSSTAPRWRCVYEFNARTADELSLQPGDLVSDAQPPRGQSGWFPESYVEDINAHAQSYSEVVEPMETKTQLEGIAEVPEAEMANDLGGAMPVV
ncbi:hypothetical protein SFRURICE_018920, partial [Spodoptera frugiperda]